MVLNGIEDPTVLLTHTLFDRIFDLFDRDGNGSIDFREASLGLKKIKPGLPLTDARDRYVMVPGICPVFVCLDD